MTPGRDEQQSVPFAGDAEGWKIAEDIRRQRPDWLVTWGSYSRQFVAYALFSMTRRVVVTARYPEALVDRMDRAEQRWRISPEGQEGEKHGQGHRRPAE